MFNTLYVRVVVTFILVVVMSLTASFYITFNFYQERVLSELEEEMIQAGKGIIRLQKAMGQENLEGYLAGISTITFNIALYSEDGEVKVFGRNTDEPMAAPSDVQKVLNGGVYRVESTEKRLLKNVTIGLPFQVEEERYALFLKPRIMDRIDIIKEALITVLTYVLIIGSLLYLVAAFLLVNPIKKLTALTTNIAKGDFQQIKSIKRKDEIGELGRSFNRMTSELTKLETMRKEFISNVSHDLQSPLTSIRGFAVALKENEFSKEQQDHYLTIIQKESERLAKLSENLLKLSVLENKESLLEKEIFRLDQQIKQVFLSHQPQWLEKKLELNLEDVNKVEITADQLQLEQVWHNLLTNSIKYSNTGGKIKVEVKEIQKKVQVIFSDTGIGIPEKDLPYIFDRFFKVDKARVRSGQGSGLGLAIVKKIIDLHKGEISIKSEHGVGTSIQIVLPK
ncbi:HAMP domain-containing histidine kinase [Sutcliffiella horikoshii]|uniref:Heme sensor protein HssS n=1 Tax=Sutcliffiella horikoshii TaxID=79883 RepID=A0AA94WNY2_9BACI|nr:HAMP domain-containing sensor histidine kinase [Sutcliffiella horikoshii]TYS58081.1 HAMP domain-containing histidine kinase [Sutcliffiella horikoshii]